MLVSVVVVVAGGVCVVGVGVGCVCCVVVGVVIVVVVGVVAGVVGVGVGVVVGVVGGVVIYIYIYIHINIYKTPGSPEEAFRFPCGSIHGRNIHVHGSASVFESLEYVWMSYYIECVPHFFPPSN